jgi:hypothetical protein
MTLLEALKSLVYRRSSGAPCHSLDIKHWICGEAHEVLVSFELLNVNKEAECPIIIQGPGKDFRRQFRHHKF